MNDTETIGIPDELIGLRAEYAFSLAELLVREMEEHGQRVPSFPRLHIELDEDEPIAPLNFYLVNDEHEGDEGDFDESGAPILVAFDRFDDGTGTFEKVLPILMALTEIHCTEITAY